MPFLARSMRQCLLALALLVHSVAALPVAVSTHRDAVAAKPSYEDAVAAELIAPDEVTVCLAAGEEGLSVRPMDGGDPEGYEADVARLVARDLSTRLGMDLTLKYVYPTLEERLEYLEQRKCDFMAELLTNDVQGQRRQSVAFTGQPYLVIHEQILVKKSSNVAGPGDCQKAAVASGSQTSRNYAENFPQVEQVLTTGYSSAAIVLLLNGTVDCIANDDLVFDKLLKEADAGGFGTDVTSASFRQVSTSNIFAPKPWGLGINIKNTLLQAELGAIMTYLDAYGEFDQPRKKWSISSKSTAVA